MKVTDCQAKGLSLNEGSSALKAKDTSIFTSEQLFERETWRLDRLDEFRAMRHGLFVLTIYSKIAKEGHRPSSKDSSICEDHRLLDHRIKNAK